MKKSPRLFFLISGLLCCLSLVGYSTSGRSTSDGTHQRQESYVALGIPLSPWYESTTKLEDGRVISSKSHINLLSWSWPVFLAGIGSLVKWRRSRPGQASYPDTP